MVETTELLGQIDEKLRVLVGLTAASVLDGLSQEQQVERLFGLGLSAKLISEVTAIPNTTVAPIVSRLRNPTKKTKKVKA